MRGSAAASPEVLAPVSADGGPKVPPGEARPGGGLRAGRLAAAEFSGRLLDWFALHGRRSLPWQQDPTPYRVWVSEVMLQQTQVAAVIPYYARFMARFPHVGALATAPLDEVLHLWTGLGYYARARNLHACAQVLVAEHGAEFPATLAAVMALPGIGRSTAGAILALSRGARHPILDGNVKRVLARVFGIAGDRNAAGTVARFWAAAEECTPGSADVAAYTQAIMDLGATLCTSARPACTVCPMNDGCIAAREGRQAELPGRAKKAVRSAREVTLLIAETGERGAVAVLLERRPSEGIWGGLWSMPEFASEAEAIAWCRREVGEPVELRDGAVRGEAEALGIIEHAFTHFDLRLHPVRVWVSGTPRPGVQDGDARLWYDLAAPPRVGLPQPIAALLERLRARAAHSQ